MRISPGASRYLGRAERGLLVLGALLLGCWAGVWVEGRVYQTYQNRQLNRLLEAGPASASAQKRQGGRLDEGILGRLEIPRVGLSVLVLNGVDAATLVLGAGRLPGTTRAGNLVIAGHRDTFFRPLRGIRRNDQIQVTTPDGTYPYVVEWTAVVDPSDTGVLAETAEPSLTLVTCYPFQYIGPAPQRFVVRARLVSAGEPPQAPTEPARETRPSPFLARHQLNQAAGGAAAPEIDANKEIAAADPPAPPPAAADSPAAIHSAHGVARFNPVHLFKKLAQAAHRTKTETVADTDRP